MRRENSMKPTCLFLKRLSLPGRPLGSALMRGDQLSAMVRPFLQDICDVRLMPFHADLTPPALLSQFVARSAPGSMVIFVKTAARGLTHRHTKALKQRGVSIGLDVVDLPLSEIDTPLFDFFIAASLAGQRALQDHLVEQNEEKPVYLIHHHADPRLTDLEIAPDRPFKCAFLGLTENAHIPPALVDDVTILHTKTGRDFERILPKLAEIPLHFAVRPSAKHGPQRSYKPFTKGFTAAACRAAILINRDADDAEALLGADYPFFIDDLTDANIVEAFRHAEEAFGGPIWKEATTRLATLKEISAPANIAKQMRDIITREQERYA